MAALEGRIGTVEAASTGCGSMASHFDRLEELLGQRVSLPGSATSDAPGYQGGIDRGPGSPAGRRRDVVMTHSELAPG
jgi:hypothetical protein